MNTVHALNFVAQEESIGQYLPKHRSRITVQLINNSINPLDTESVFHNCTLNEVLALVRNRCLQDGQKRKVQDDQGYVQYMG